MELFGQYDVVVTGAGVAGVVAAIRAAREGAKTLLIEAGEHLGGLATGGRLTKPSGVVNGGVFSDLLEDCARYGAADRTIRRSHWGAYTGSFDSETMQRAILEAVEAAGVETLFRTQVVAARVNDGCLDEIEIQVKSGRKTVWAKTFIDASGDGDVAALAGVPFLIGRKRDNRVQPMTAYVRVVNVNMPRFLEDCLQNRDDVWELVLPEGPLTHNEDFLLTFVATGFRKRIARAREDGCPWIIPKDHITFKSGLIPGELNLNVTRFHGNALDERVLSRAEIELRKQAYCAFDFLREYVRGFEEAVFLEVAPRLGVRETRRIQGEYVLTETDVRSGARFDDAIGLCNAPISAHDPEGDKSIMESVGGGYGIPFRCLMPLGLRGLLLAGRCISADEVAFASTRNVPACAITGEAAGTAAALVASPDAATGKFDLHAVQQILRRNGMVLGTPEDTAGLAGV